MTYPSILKRVQSTFVDQIITFSFIGLLFVCANEINEELIWLKVLAFFVGFSYEPLFMLTGRTVGQRITGIRTVWKSNSFILIIASYLRYVAKLLLGWVSFLTLFFSQRRRAIHDMLAGTIVINNNDYPAYLTNTITTDNNQQ